MFGEAVLPQVLAKSLDRSQVKGVLQIVKDRKLWAPGNGVMCHRRLLATWHVIIRSGSRKHRCALGFGRPEAGHRDAG